MTKAREAYVARSVVFGMLLGWNWGALAHSLDCKGHPVPTSTKWNCCGLADYHLLDASQVHENDDGSWDVVVKVKGKDLILHVEKEHALPSVDGCFGIFFNPDSDSGRGHTPWPYCFFFVPSV